MKNNGLFKSKIRNAKMKILQVASALTICLGGIFGSTLPLAANTVGTSFTVYCTNQSSAGSFTLSGNLDVDVYDRSGAKGGYWVHGTINVSSSSNGSWWGKGVYLKNSSNGYLGGQTFKNGSGSVAISFKTSVYDWPKTATSERLYLVVGAANSTLSAMNYTISNTGANQTVYAKTSGGNTYNGGAYVVEMKIPAGSYNVTYDGNGGLYNGSSTWSNEADYNASYTTYSNDRFFVRNGYTFTGWNEKADGSGTDWTTWINKPWTYTYTRDVTLYAQWKAHTYSITYNGNGADYGNTASSSHTYGNSKKLTKNGYVRDGYQFLGWSTSPNGSVQYSEEQSVSNLTATNGATINLYAQWKQLGYEINYDGNGADGGSTSTQYAPFNQTTTLNKNGYYKKGHKFKEWNTKTDGSGESYKDQQSISVDSNKTVTKK